MLVDWSHEETDNPGYADRRNFYKVEKRSRDGQRVEAANIGAAEATPATSLW
jgi:hypothetical protein